MTNLSSRLIANITRCFFWLGNRFEFALLLQSILMILAQVSVMIDPHPTLAIYHLYDQLALLYICIRYWPRISVESITHISRPLSFWQWHSYTQYIEFLAGFMCAIRQVLRRGY
jgi:hypothetical protein